MYFTFLFLFWRLKHAPTLKVSLRLYDVTIQFSFSCIHAELYFVHLADSYYTLTLQIQSRQRQISLPQLISQMLRMFL